MSEGIVGALRGAARPLVIFGVVMLAGAAFSYVTAPHGGWASHLWVGGNFLIVGVVLAAIDGLSVLRVWLSSDSEPAERWRSAGGVAVIAAAALYLAWDGLA